MRHATIPPPKRMRPAAPSDSTTSFPAVSIVVLNWRRADDTLECLDSLTALDYQGPMQIVVCDNDSGDDSLVAIEQWARGHEALPGGAIPTSQVGFTLLATGANRGYGGGNNVGISFTIERHEPYYIWILNNDTTVTPSALSHLIEYARKHGEVGAIGSTLVDYYAPDTVLASGGGHYSPALSIARHVNEGKILKQVLETPQAVTLSYVSGASMFVSSRAFRAAGLFDERYFLYYEELDLAQRLRAHGWGLGYSRESIVLHKQGRSTRAKHGKAANQSEQSAFHENLSTLLFTRKHHVWLLPLVVLVRLFAKLALCFWRRQPRLIPVLFSSFAAFFATHPSGANSGQPPRQVCALWLRRANRDDAD